MAGHLSWADFEVEAKNLAVDDLERDLEQDALRNGAVATAGGALS